MLQSKAIANFAILVIFSCWNFVATDQSLLPPIKFIADFAQFFITKSVILHTHTHEMTPELIEFAKQINKEGHYFVIANIQENCTVDLQNVDMHLVMIDDDQSLTYFTDCSNQRKRYNKEPWILYSRSMPNDLIPSLNEATLDLDDEIYLASAQNNETYLTEIYKIGPDSNIDFNDVGVWSEIDNINFTTNPKWYRRGDLKV